MRANDLWELCTDIQNQARQSSHVNSILKVVAAEAGATRRITIIQVQHVVMCRSCLLAPCKLGLNGCLAWRLAVKQAIQDPFLRCSIVVTLPQPFDSFSRVYIIDILDFNSYLLPRWICWCLWSAFNALKCLNAELKRLDSFWHLTSSSFPAFMTAGLTCSSHQCWKVMESRWVTGTSLVRSLTQAHGD